MLASRVPKKDLVSKDYGLLPNTSRKLPKSLTRIPIDVCNNMLTLFHSAGYNEEIWAQRVFKYHDRPCLAFDATPPDSFINAPKPSLSSFSDTKSQSLKPNVKFVKPEHICKTSWTESEDLLLWNLVRLNKSWDEIAIALDLPIDTVYNRFIEKHGMEALL